MNTFGLLVISSYIRWLAIVLHWINLRLDRAYEENNNMMIIIDPTSTQRHVAFLLRQLSIGSEAALWFALTTM
jgi:hypothetical protein